MNWQEFELPDQRSDLFRELIVLLVDGSESMGKVEPGSAQSRFEEMADALDALLIAKLPGVADLAAIGEVAVGVFAGTGTTWLNLSNGPAGTRFHRVSALRWTPGALAAPRGRTPLASAVLEAAEVLDERLRELRESPAALTAKHPPIILAVTDGRPTDDREVFFQAAEMLRLRAFRRRSPEFLFAALGVRGAAEDVLRGLAPDSTFMLGARPMSEVVEAMLKTITALTADGDPLGGAGEGASADLSPEYQIMRKVMSGFDDY